MGSPPPQEITLEASLICGLDSSDDDMPDLADLLAGRERKKESPSAD